MAEDDWITTQQAARMLGLSDETLYKMVPELHLQRRKEGRQGYLRLDEVEGLARDPARLRRRANRERNNVRRWTAPAEAGPLDLIDAEAAARLLGVTRSWLVHLVSTGQLCAYEIPRGRHRDHRFSAAEVAAFGSERKQRLEAQARRRAEQEPTKPRRFPSARRRLEQARRIEVDDISVWERYFGEWITTRQVAMLLHITMQSVYKLRKNGRLVGVRQETLVTGRVQWHYRKADVLKLMCEPKYFERHARYEQSVDPERRAAKKKAESESNWDACWRGMQAWRREHGLE